MVTNVSQDAVVVVPGIMGSRLIDAESGDVLWGLDLSWYGSAWLRNKPWRRLAVTDDERAGRTGRVVADKLLDLGAFSPVVGGIEPYTYMTRRLRTMVAHEAAVLAFPYDWRLSVAYNGARLAEAIEGHIKAWRAHPAAVAATRQRPGQREPQVVVIAHSMGGLVCRAMCAIPGASADVRAVLTLGTPFRGAAKGATVLAFGEGAPFPLPRKRLRRMARTLPGLHDLLPVYRSVELASTVRRLTASDVTAFGGNAEMSEESRLRHDAHADVAMPAHQVYAGGWQTTPSTLHIEGGVVSAHPHSFNVNPDGSLVVGADGRPLRVDRFGDGTVPLASALPSTGTATVVSQQHGALARVEEALSQASAILLEETEAPVHLGDTDLGLELPDLVPVGDAPIVAWVTGEHASSATASVYDERNALVDMPAVRLAAGRTRIEIGASRPGILRVEVRAGGSGAVTQWVSVQDPAADEGDDAPGDD